MRRTDEEKAYIEANVVDWDEHGQGYDKNGKVIVCICGQVNPPSPHYCSYDERDPRESEGPCSEHLFSSSMVEMLACPNCRVSTE